MPAAYSTLKITDGTVTADLVDGTNYQLLDSSYAPAVSCRRRGKMGGRGPYEEVIETIVVTVRGSTGAVALSNLAKLSELLDQADRWATGDTTVAVVKVQIQPQGSTLTQALEAVVLGRPTGAGSWLNLPMTFNDYLHLYEIGPVAVTFLRRGQWLYTVETPSAAAAEANPNIQSVTFTANPKISSPVKVMIRSFGNDAAVLSDSILMVATSEDDLKIIEGESGSPDGGVTFASQADSANNARGGSVGRHSSPSATTFNGVSFDPSGTVITDKRVRVVVALRNNSASISWQLYATLMTDGREGPASDIVPIDTSTTNPRLVDFGTLTMPFIGLDSVRLYFKASGVSGSPTIDIDYILLMAADSPDHHIIKLLSDSEVASVNDLIVDPQQLTGLAPYVYADDTLFANTQYALIADGDPWLTSTGQTLATIWAATRANYWRWSVNAGTVFSPTMQAARQAAYLVPQ